MSEKVSFFRSAAFDNLMAAVLLFGLTYFLLDIDSVLDWSWWDYSIGDVLVVVWMVKFFWLCGERLCTGRWREGKRRREGEKGTVLGCVLGWCFVILIIGTVVVLRLKFGGPHETIDGVTWRYVVKDGKAVIERYKNSYGRPAISVTTSGALEIPSVLGGYSVVGIGRDAFHGCKKLTSVTIPESVRYLDYDSFENCWSLQSVIVKGELNWIYNAFDGCVGLKEFVVPPENEHMQAVDGMLLNKDGTRLLAGLGGNVSIPEGVASIDGYAFAGRVDLESVIIPNGVTNIGGSAFRCCKGLKSVVIPRGVADIGFCTFQDCETLSSVVIPDGVRSIGAFAFKGCRSLSSVVIPDGVRSIGAFAFKGCRSLYSVKLPESVTGIGNDAFRDCSILTSVHVPSNVVQIGNGAFAGTPFLDGRPDGLIVFSGIAYRWKGQCPAEVEIPDGVTRIFDKAFYHRGQMKSVTIPKTVKGIGDLSFAGCRSLTSVIIPEGVTNLEHGAFNGCDQLTAVSIPRSLTKVSGGPFLFADIRTVYVAKGDVERVKGMAEELGIKVNSEKWNFGSNEAKFVECDEYPNPPGEGL